MKTLLTASPQIAARILTGGGLVAFPTETVYGLGAALDQPQALAAIFAAKGRPADNPVIVHVAAVQAVEPLALELSDSARRLMAAFFPGPLTVVVPKTERVPLVVTAGRSTVAIRMPDHLLARAFLEACQVPVAAPSANLSGRPSPTTWEAVQEDLDGRIDCILQGEGVRVGLESTVVDCTQDPPVLLRAGGITVEAMRDAGVSVRLATAADVEAGRRPGTRFRHYAPRAQVRLVEAAAEAVPSPDAAFIGVDSPGGHFASVEVVPCSEAYAHRLFAFFRQCDRLGVRVIYCQTVPRQGLGQALIDRLDVPPQASTHVLGGWSAGKVRNADGFRRVRGETGDEIRRLGRPIVTNLGPHSEYYLPDSKVIAGYNVQSVQFVEGLTVLLQVQNDKGETFAMKVPTRTALKDRTLPRRFDREIDIMNKLQGSHFPVLRGCGVYAVDTHHNIPYILTDMPNGYTLDVLLETQKAAATEPDLEGAVHLLRGMAEVLVTVHKAGVVHRNLKPSNIAVDVGGEVQLLDFVLGLDASPMNLTRDKEFVGSSLYVAPEQALDPHHVDGRADLYSLGLIIYEYATHHQPFEASGPAAMSGVIKRFNQDPDPPSRFNPKISPELENILIRLTKRQLNVRYQTAHEVLEAVDHHFPQDKMLGMM